MSAGIDLTTWLGPANLKTPLVAASGTLGSVVEFAGTIDLSAYGAAVAKSVSRDPWPGRPAPRLASVGAGMLNSIGIQNPGVAQWRANVGPQLAGLPVQVWGSAVGRTPAEFAEVAAELETAGVASVEVNLSCPNLDDGRMFALDAEAAGTVVKEVRAAVKVPIGAKLSPNAADIVDVAVAIEEAGADWAVLTNTVWGAGIDPDSRRPLLSGGIGGYSGPPLKPIALRCVMEVHRRLPELPILGCGGVSSGRDVVEYLLAGASAVAIGTAHFANPRIGRTVLAQLAGELRRRKLSSVSQLTGTLEGW